MSSALLDVADAVVAQLNGRTFSMNFTAVRAYVPVYDLGAGDLDELRVTVVPKSCEMLRGEGTRTADMTILAVDVGVQMKVANFGAAVDALMVLTQEILDFLRRRDLATASGVALVKGAENKPVFSPDHLSQRSVFTSVVSMTYRMLR